MSVWTEWSFNDEGMGLTLYEDGVVVDETWLTWDEAITQSDNIVLEL